MTELSRATVAVTNLPATQPVSGTVAVTNANLDVALSTRALESGGNLASLVASTAVVGATAPTRGIQTSGVDPLGKLRGIALSPRGRIIDASADFYGRNAVAESFITARGFAVEAANDVLFSKVEGTGGTVTYNATTGEYDVATTVTSGSTAIHIGNCCGLYREGWPSVIFISGNLDSTSSTNKRIEWAGYGQVASSVTALQTADAIGFYLENGVLGIFYRSSLNGAYPGNTINVPQASWNVDILDGSGISGFTFTLASLFKITLFEIEYLWLGAAGIEFRIAGRVVHRVDFSDPANATAAPYTRVPHFRVGVFARNSGASSASTFSANCCAIHSKGGGAPLTASASGNRLTAFTSMPNGTAVPLYALRVASAAKCRRLIPKKVQVRNTTQDVLFQVYVGKASDFTFTGGAWAAIPNTPGTLAEQNITTTAVTIGANAKLEAGLYVESATGVGTMDLTGVFDEISRWVGINGDGVQLNMVIVATSQAASNGAARIVDVQIDEIG